jgi:DNA-binding CsgD family transcriptional regulator
MTAIGLPDLVAQAFEAACDLDGLDDWLKNLADYFGVSGSALVIWPNNEAMEIKIVSHGVSPDHIRERFEHRHEPGNLFGQAAKVPEGQICIIEEAGGAASLPPDDRPVRAKRPVIIGVVLVDDVHRCFLTLFRDADHDEFSQLEIDTLRTLVGYFQRAVLLNRRFIDIVSMNKTMLVMLNNAPRGIVSLGQNGQVTFMNTEAQRIFSQADGLSLTGNVINFHEGQIRTKFSEFVATARQRDAARTEQSLMMNVSVKRNLATTPYQIMAYTLPFNKGQAALNPDEALAILMIQDPSTHLQLRLELLQTFYNLSSAEARLAAALWKGHSLPEAAVSLHVSVNTARSQLRGIFKKVGVSTQALLLQELAAGLKDVEQDVETSRAI